MKACIKTGQMRVIYPDGTEQSYGPPESSLKAILRVMDYRFFSQILAGSDIALGEAFMAGYPPETGQFRDLWGGGVAAAFTPKHKNHTK